MGDTLCKGVSPVEFLMLMSMGGLVLAWRRTSTAVMCPALAA